MESLASESVLSRRTLVLNRSWMAVTTTTVRRAMSLVYQEAARIICPNSYEIHDFGSWAELSVAQNEPCIRTVASRLRVPEVIVLTIYDGMPRRRVAFSRRNLYRRDSFACQYCGAQPGSEELTIDHIVPRSEGGRTTWSNCVLACISCNMRKANRSLGQTGMVLLKTPKEPRWTWDVEIALGRRRASWEHFLSDRYWNIELVD